MRTFFQKAKNSSFVTEPSPKINNRAEINGTR